ncbi:MAG: glycoside hydrolase family 16 protein [Caldilineaceae bacterium]
MSDDFSGPVLDTTKWSTEYGSGGNGEKQYYAPDAFEFQDGLLRIRADRRAMKNYPYTSGIIHSWHIFDQEYGYFKMRAKVPKGKGLWPAFWLLPTTKARHWEIDIFEILGDDTNTVHLTNHWPDSEGNYTKGKTTFTGPDFSEDFHIFGLEWSPTEIIWSIDYVERYRTTRGVPHEPMFLLANLAVGGNWPGDPDSLTPFPSYFDIDYIQVYERACQVFLPTVSVPAAKQ